MERMLCQQPHCVVMRPVCVPSTTPVYSVREGPTVARHLPCVPKKYLRYTQDVLACSLIALHAKISGHSRNTSVLSILDSGKPFSGLLSSLHVSMALTYAPSFHYFRPHRARGRVLWSPKLCMCSHITHELHQI